MKAVIDAELRRRGRDPGRFVYTTLISTGDVDTIRKDIDGYVSAGMNYFTLGDKAKDEGSLRNLETVAREVGGSL
jgi:hypothetical protein